MAALVPRNIGLVHPLCQIRRPLQSISLSRIPYLATDDRRNHPKRLYSSKNESSDQSNCRTTARDARKEFLGTTRILDPLVVCGVSGVGKGRVITRFLEVQDDQLFHLHQTKLHIKDPVLPKYIEFKFVVSHTTRPRRPDEKNGVHYHFISEEQMEKFINLGKDGDYSTISPAALGPNNSFFIEHATIYDYEFGTSWSALEAAHFKPRNPSKLETPNSALYGTDKAKSPPPLEDPKLLRKAILDIDVQGVQQLKELEANLQKQFEQGIEVPYLIRPKYLFIAPPSYESLKERLQARGSCLEESFQRRMRRAIGEMNYGLDSLCYKFDPIIKDQLYRKSLHFPRIVTNSVTVNHTVDIFMDAVDRLYDLKDRPMISATGKEDMEENLIYEELNVVK